MKNQMFTKSEKKEIVEYYSNHTEKETMNKFLKLNTISNVFRWRKELNSHNLTEINHIQKLLVRKLKAKFPGKPYTVFILLWDDGTCRVRCQYGHKESDYASTIHIFQWYEQEFSYLTEVVPDGLGTE